MGAVDEPSTNRPKPTSRDTAVRASPSAGPTSFFLTTDPSSRPANPSIDEKEQEKENKYPVLEELKKGRVAEQSTQAIKEDENEGKATKEEFRLGQSTDFGVQSLAAGLEAEPEPEHEPGSGSEDKPEANTQHDDSEVEIGRRSTITPNDTLHYVPSSLMPSVSPSPHRTRQAQASDEMQMAWSITSLSALSTEPGSEAPSSPISYRHSDEEAILSEAESLPKPELLTSQITEGAASVQLVMPSLLMPHRRAFTARGERLRKLRIVLAGTPGSGKTTLLKEIIKSCADIVHIDTSYALEESLANIGRAKHGKRPAYREVAACTRAYPSWRDDDKKRSKSRRRKEEVLQRNVHFTDMAGETFQDATFKAEKTTVVQYIKAQMDKACDVDALKESELLALLSGEGSAMVDVVLYLIRDEPNETDKKLVRFLSEMTNVIPILTFPSTSQDDSEITSKTSRIAESLSDSTLTTLPHRHSSRPSQIYAVHIAPSTSLEAMDASLLMSSTLPVPSNSSLAHLTTDLFDGDNALYLEHTAARKLLHYRAVRAATLSKYQYQYQRGRNTTRRTIPLSLDGEHRLAGWADKLRDANDVSSTAMSMATKTRRYAYEQHEHDPLGIVALMDGLSSHGWLALKLVGSFGVLGAVAMYLGRARVGSDYWIANWGWGDA